MKDYRDEICEAAWWCYGSEVGVHYVVHCERDDKKFRAWTKKFKPQFRELYCALLKWAKKNKKAYLVELESFRMLK